MKRTKLEFLNYYILQWFFVRLTKHVETIIEDYEVFSYDVVGEVSIDKPISISSRGIGKTVKKQRWSIQYWVYPFTGYDGKIYRYVNHSQNFLYLTKYKNIK